VVQIVGTAHNQACVKVRQPARCLGNVRVIANVNAAAEAGDLEGVTIASSVENLFAGEEMDLAATDRGAMIWTMAVLNNHRSST
jgi:hypothetical protein